MARTSADLYLDTKKETANFSNDKGSSAKNISTNFDAIAALVQDLRFNVVGKVEKSHVESALQILFWPTTENVWEKAEAICMEKAKEIFSQILNGDEDLQAPTPNLKECLRVLVYLGEIRESASR
jgi:hypothetical protein